MSITVLTGQKLAGIYMLHGLIAHGAHGVVYDARNTFTGVRYAVKVFYPEVLEADSLARCRRDSDMAAALHHPGIVRTIEWSRRDALPLIFQVMEFAEGENVQSRIRRLGRLSPQQVLELGLRVGMTLSAAHKLGILHRGMTPRNLLYTQAGPDALEQGEIVKVLDFGVAHLPVLAGLEEELLPYVATEMGRGEEIDARGDQFSLGAILYEALSGRVPPVIDEIALDGGEEAPAAPSLQALCPDAPQYMVRAIERAMSPVRSDRFSSLIDFTRALDDRGLSPFRTSSASMRSSASSLGARSSGSSSDRLQALASERSGRSAASVRSPSSRATPAQPRSSTSSQRIRVTGGPPSAQSAGGAASYASGAHRREQQAGRTPERASGRSVREELLDSPRRAASINSLTPIAVQPASSQARQAGVTQWRLWTSLGGLVAVSGLALYLILPLHPSAESGEAAVIPRLQPALAAPAAIPAPPSPSDAEEETQRLLADGELALGQGDHARAIELARPAIPAARAWRVIAAAACRMGNVQLQSEAMEQLSEGDRALVQDSCRKK